MQIHKKSLISTTKKLRQTMTPWEEKLWYFLRAKRFFGLKFKRQVMIGEYIVDFCCNEKKVIIELDGGHHNDKTKQRADKSRQVYLENQGYKVIRFWNNQIDENIEGVLERIEDKI